MSDDRKRLQEELQALVEREKSQQTVGDIRKTLPVSELVLSPALDVFLAKRAEDQERMRGVNVGSY